MGNEKVNIVNKIHKNVCHLKYVKTSNQRFLSHFGAFGFQLTSDGFL